MRLPAIEGLIESLVGPGSVFDHHFLHPALPASVFEKIGHPHVSQHTHQDSTIDPRFEAFDIQLMYYPHDVTPEMGGTRFVPGTHLRKVSEAAVARYQNMASQEHVVCAAGTVLIMHHGIWHGGGINRTEERRQMFKIRLQPRVPQTRLRDTSDLVPEDSEQKPIFWADRADPDAIDTILCQPESWFEADTGRLEYLNRIRLWRSLVGDPDFDARYWVTRVETAPG